MLHAFVCMFLYNVYRDKTHSIFYEFFLLDEEFYMPNKWSWKNVSVLIVFIQFNLQQQCPCSCKLSHYCNPFNMFHSKLPRALTFYKPLSFQSLQQA